MSWFSALLKSLPFANGAMLLWGLAAGLPIIIHLWSKRKYNEVTWAAMEYLLAAVRKNVRRIRIEQLILLLIRVAILILLAVALADPIFSLFPTLGSSLGTAGQTHFVLVLDGSYSMGYKASEKSRFELAQQLAVQVVEDSRQGDGFTLVLMADPPVVAISEPAFDPKDVTEEIENLLMRHGGADLPATLAEVERILHKGETLHSRLTDQKVCFFTDLGRTTWEDSATEACRGHVGRLADKASLILFDVGQTEVENLAIAAMDVRESLVTIARDITVDVEVQNLGRSDRSGRRVAIFVDDQEVHTDRIDVSAGGQATLAFAYRFDTPGEHKIEARLADDALAVDNHRWVSVPVRESINVLCIEGKQGAARYVALALEPSKSEHPRVRPDVQFEHALLERELGEYDCVFLCNVGRFGRDESAVLYEYLKNGGGLIVSLGDQVQADSYNEQLGGELSGIRILPVRLERPSAEAQYAFDPRDYRHAIVAEFAGHERSGLISTPVWKYFKATRYDSTSARVALAFHNGDPAIVEEPILRGRSIVLTTAASPESVDRTTDPPTPWTALAYWPSFPALVQEMLALAVGGRTSGRNLLVGDAVEGSVARAASGLTLTIEGPDGESDRVPMKTDGEHSRWVYDRAMWSGMYTARYGEPPDKVESFAVNVNTRESDLGRFDPELLPSQFNLDFSPGADAASLPATKPMEYFRWFLGAVFVLLLVESFAAWYFGNASS
jgi:hypothetical protein